MTEKLLVKLPDSQVSGEVFIAAIAALAAYQKMLTASQREYALCVEGFTDTDRFLSYALAEHTTVPDIGAQLDLDFVFDPSRALELALPTNMHMADAFGIMLGVDQPFPYPDLSKLPVELQVVPTATIGYFDCDFWWEQAEALEEIVAIQMPNAEQRQIYANNDLLYLFNHVAACHTVVGPQCAATYMAAALGCNVLELIAPATELNLFSKPYKANVARTEITASATLLWGILRNKGWL